MMYDLTHRLYPVVIDWDSKAQQWPIIELCRQELGDNDINQPLQDRPWFTSYNGVWIRRDCTHRLETFLALKAPG